MGVRRCGRKLLPVASVPTLPLRIRQVRFELVQEVYGFLPFFSHNVFPSFWQSFASIHRTRKPFKFVVLQQGIAGGTNAAQVAGAVRDETKGKHNSHMKWHGMGRVLGLCREGLGNVRDPKRGAKVEFASEAKQALCLGKLCQWNHVANAANLHFFDGRYSFGSCDRAGHRQV